MLRNPNDDGAPSHNDTMYMGSVIKFGKISLPFFTKTTTMIILTSVLFLGIVVAVGFACVLAISTESLKPITVLNDRMRDLYYTWIHTGVLGDIPIDEHLQSKDISLLYQMFEKIISEKKFASNDYMHKSDTLAVIDLAEACYLFESDGPNYKAASVCYNNIANLQFKSGRYRLASENFEMAYRLALACLHEIDPWDVYTSKSSTRAELKRPDPPG